MAVERHIGQFKALFRSMLKDRTLHYDPTTCGKLVYAAGTLHNFRISHNVLNYSEYEGDTSDSDANSDSDSESETSNEGKEDGPVTPQIAARGNENVHPGELFTFAGNNIRNFYSASFI